MKCFVGFTDGCWSEVSNDTNSFRALSVLVKFILTSLQAKHQWLVCRTLDGFSPKGIILLKVQLFKLLGLKVLK